MAPLLFVSLVPFLLSLERARGLRHSLFRGGTFGALTAIGITWWIVTAAHLQYGIPLVAALLLFLLIAIIPMALIYMIFAAGYHYLYRNSRHRCLVLAGVPSLWIACDFCVSLLPFGVPWIFSGYAAAPMSLFIQAADTGGVYLLSFIIAAINTSIFLAVRELRVNGTFRKPQLNRIVFPLVSLVLITGIVFIYGIYGKKKWGSSGNNAAPGIDVVLVQGNFTSRERWEDDSIYQRLEVYRSMTEGAAVKDRQTMVIWPETVINSSRVSHEKIASDMIQLLGEKAVLITGAVTGAHGKRVHNSAYIISGNNWIARYDKNILLPYAESSPFGIQFLDRFYNAPQSFDRGNTAPVVKTRHGKTGITICFEQVYPEYVRKSVTLGAGMLVNISNDSWFGNTTEPMQHLNCSIIRAVEHRRYMLRSANSGYSAIVNPSGELQKVSSLFTRETVEGRAGFTDHMTVYSRYGDVILYPALLILLSALGTVAFFNDR